MVSACTLNCSQFWTGCSLRRTAKLIWTQLMDKKTRENWVKLKEVLERAGKTDTHYYVRAVIIAKGGEDPFDSEPGKLL